MGYEPNDVWGIDKDPKKEYDDRDIKDLERRVGSLKKKIEQQNEHIDNLKDKIGELREQDDWDDTRNIYDRTPRVQKIYDLKIDLRDAENNLIKKTDDLKSLLNEIESIQKDINTNEGHEVISGYINSYEREINKNIEEYSKAINYQEKKNKQVSQQIDKVKTSLPEGTKQSTSRRRNLETPTPKQVYKPKQSKPKVLAVDESTGDVYDINTGVVEEGDISIIGKANYNDDGSISGLTAESRTIAPNTYDLGSFVNLDKILDENRATKIFNDNFKYSTMLNIMKAPEEANPLLTKEGKVRAKHQKRARKEYKKLVGEIVGERHRLYEELEEIKAYGFDLEDEIVKTLENKIAGLSYLEKELGLLMQRHGDSPLREEETPGSLRAVKDAYEKAEYMTQIGEGVGQAVHHLDGYNWFTGGRIDPSNLILLSNEIHDEFHDIYGKGNNSLEQFYEFLSNYHPQELPKFEEFLKGAKNIDEKLLGASEDWDNDTWRKQFNRWMSIPWISDIHNVDADIQYDKIPYSSFFLRNMEVPIDGTYKDSNGNEHDRAQVNTSSNTALDIYDSVTEQEMEKWKNTKDLDILRHILHSRQITESINGMLKEEDVADIDKMKHWSKDKLLSELGESQIRGRLFLQSRNVGKELPFLGVGFDELDGENSPFSGTGLGSGFLPVMDKLKKFFDNYSDYFDIGENPLEGWDSNGDMSPFSTNANIIQRVFGDETFLQKLKNHIINELPIDDTSGISTAHDPVKAKISRFNQEYYANPNDPEKKAFREARADISYLIGISKGGASIDTIGRFLAPKRTVTVGADEVEAYEENGFYVIGKNKDGQVRLARDYARKPLKADDSRNAWGKAPKPTADKVTVDAGEVEAYENRGYRVVGEKGAKIVLAKDVYGDYPDDHPIGHSHPYRGVEIREGSGEEDDGWELGDEGFSRYDYGFDVDEPILYPKPPSCCEQALKLLGEINETINSVGETIADALKNFKGGFRGSIYDENGMLSFDRGSSSVGAEPKDKFYSGYKTRVNELEELIKSTEDEGIKKFAKDALSVAERMDKHGLRKSEWNQDLVYAIFGEYPKRENFSLEEEEKVRGELAEIRRVRRNSTTQEIFDENIKKIDKEIEKVKESSKNYFEDETDGKTLSKQAYLSRLEARKRKWENKEIIGEDRYKFLELEEEAYKKVLNQPSPTEHYNDHINNYIKGIEGVKGYHELGTRSRFLETRGRLNEMGIDVSEEEEKAVAKINRLVSSYKKELKKDISESEKDDIQQTIDKLLELKSLLDNNGEWWALLPSNDVPNVINDMPMKGSNAFNSGIHHANVLLYGSDEELVRTFGKYWAEEDENGVKKLTPERRERMLESLSPYRLQDDSEGETKQFTQTELAYKRFDYLRERYENTKETIERFRSNLDLLKDKGGAEQFDALIERLEYFKSELDSLADKDLRRTKLREQVKELTDDFYELSKTSERILGDDLLRRAEEASLQSINERNRLGMSALFGDETAQKELFGEPPVPKPEKAPLEGRLTRMAYNFRQASQSANQFSGVLTKLFSIVGTGNALNDMITASSLRQTNQIMLASSRGMEEAKKLYDRIQMLVVKLPGNDTFLTNILTMLGTMDKSLSAEDLEYMGGVIADYYMGAQAKGQFNNETERELRNYLMTGQTRNLTNSIIASEIESLKGLNSVKERTVALEKALQATGMDSIAHYDSYTNSLEEFKGRFQKAFADLGDLYLGLLQGGMKVYNFLDSLTNSALSQFVITIAVGAMGLLAFFGIMAELLSMSAGLIEAFDVMNKLITDNDKQYSGLAQTFREVITWIAFKTGVINADTASQVINTDATIASTISQKLNTLGTMENVVAKLTSAVTNIRLSITAYISMWSRFAELDATTLETIAELGNTKVKIIARLVTYRQIIANTLNTISTLILAGALRSTTKEYMRYVKAKIESALIDTLIIALEWGATIATMAWYGATLLLSGALTVVSALLSPIGLLILGIVGAVWLLVKAFEGVGQIFGWWTNIGEMFQAIGDGIRRTWDAFMNSEPIQYMITTFQNLSYTLGTLFNWITSIGGNIWQTIFGVDDGSKSQVFDIVGVFLEVIGAIGKIAFTPLKIILDIINAIGSAIAWFLDTWNQFVDSEEFQGIIKDFQEIRAVIGEAWNALSEAFNEVRDAFMSVFEDDGDMKKTVETTNILLDVLRAVAVFLRVTIIPIIKFIAYVIKGIADVIKFVVDVGVGVIDFFTGGSLTQDSSNLVNQSQLAQSYSHQISNAQTIINNNFASGSVLTDARNMTAKEVMKLFTSAFGFNKARGVNGVIN